MGCGLVVADNAQRGIGKIQKHNRLKWNRAEAAVSVQTHLVVYENSEDKESLLFKNSDMGPDCTDFHPLFRPVSSDFLHIFKIRLKIDEEVGHKVCSVILTNLLGEVIKDVECGKGVSSLSLLQRLSETSSGKLPKVCTKCHTKQDYNENTQNICSCGNNPSVYTTGETNPYLKFGLTHGEFKPIHSFELEPIDLNPSSYDSLSELMTKIHADQETKQHKLSVLGVDGLPGVRLKRMQSDHVKCSTHDVMFKLSNLKLCVEHNKSICQIVWVLGDKVILLGESHEEIFLNLRAAAAAAKFGLLEVLQELGKKSKQNQNQAIKKKELNKLFPVNLIFIEGALKALMGSYVESAWPLKSSLDGFVKFCVNSTNPLMSSLFLSIYHFMLPAYIKRLGLRLHRPDIADGASALGKEIHKTNGIL